MPLPYQEIRRLDLAPGAHPRGLAFLSAASGLVRVRSRLYVVADDELHLGVFDADDTAPLHLVRLFDGELPAAEKARKARKPDLESLLLLPPGDDSPDGSLLALGSGSRPNRFAGALLRLDARGDPLGRARRIDLEPLYRDLAARFDGLNIEGACIAGDSLLLLQRGLTPADSAAVRFDLAEMLAWIDGRLPGAPRPRSVRAIDLGRANGVPYAFTDGAALPDGSWVFSAVAEDRDDSYRDGPCVAAAIGVCGSDDTLQSIELLEPTRKVEGIEATLVGTTVRLGLVTDADDPHRPAEFGTTTLVLPALRRQPGELAASFGRFDARRPVR
jgi:hypothetical protein